MEVITFSNGWLRQFKKRHNLKQIRMHGESGSVSELVIGEAITGLKQLTNNYAWKDIHSPAKSIDSNLGVTQYRIKPVNFDGLCCDNLLIKF